MVDRVEQRTRQTKTTIEGLDWLQCKDNVSLGDLYGVVFLAADPTKRNLFKELASVQAYIKMSQPNLAKDRCSLEVDMFLSYNKRGPKSVAVAALAKFYNSFFHSAVTTTQMTTFLHENVSLVVTRRAYSTQSKFVSQVVAALTFTRPRMGQATYIAYLAVSNGQGPLPSYSNPKIVNHPHDGRLSLKSVLANKDVGYQGLGLGSMLVALLHQLMCSPPFRLATESPYGFLHYNAHNEGSKEFWLSLGYAELDHRKDKSNKQLPEYQTLVRGMRGSPIFNASHSDSDNCKILVHLTSDAATDDGRKNDTKPSKKQKTTTPLITDDWFTDYTSGLTKPFQSVKPTAVYALDPHEIEAKYETVKKEERASLSFILEMAMERKQLREDRGYMGQFTNQEYINYACLQDPNRTIEVDISTLEVVGREGLLRVVVDSYTMPGNVSLKMASEQDMQLKPKAVIVECNWSWLQHELVPEVAANLEELIFGIRVIEGVGLDHPDTDVANRDVASMASFLGVHKRVQDFVSPPVSHLKITLPDNDFGGSEAKDKFFTERLEYHARQTKDFEAHVLSLGILKTPPPLPREPYQISRLKWIPTDDPAATDEMKKDRGYFQGAYVVPGTTEFSIVSLKDDWILHDFHPDLLLEIKLQGIEGLRAKERFVVIPPGSSKSQPLPPRSMLFYLRKCRFQQGDDSTCLLDCFSSAMYDFGCKAQVHQLRNHPDVALLNQTNTGVWGDFGNLVNRHYKDVDLQLFRQNTNRQVNNLLACDDSFVIIATLVASDGMVGQHAVAIFNGGIYDANCTHVLKKTQEALDWCCGDGPATCTGVHRSYQMLPKNHKEISLEMRFVFQTRDENNCNVRGWVAASKGKLPIVQFADGNRRHVSVEELGMFTRLT
jgi:hypothetical protein